VEQFTGYKVQIARLSMVKPKLKIVKHSLKTLSWKELLKRIIHGLFYYYAICYNNKMHIKSFCGVQGRFFQKEPLAAGG